MSVSSKTTLELIDDEQFQEILKKVENFISENNEEAFKNLTKKALVVGDIGLDEYMFGSVSRISPEAPVPILKLLETELKLGLAANVAKNIASLGGVCDIVGLAGDDLAAGELLRIFKSFKGINPILIQSSERPTIKKTRVLSKHHHLLRIDQEEGHPLSKKEFETTKEKLSSLDWSMYSSVILEDYGKGFLTKEVCEFVIAKARELKIKVLVDPSKGVNPKKFNGAYLFKPNYNETMAYNERAAFSQDKEGEDLKYEELLSWLKSEGDFEVLVSTLGADGMALFSNEKKMRVQTFAKKVFDVTGAGDTVIAALSFALDRGLEVDEACAFANLAAGYVVGEVGAVPCSIDNIRTQMKRFSKSV